MNIKSNSSSGFGLFETILALALGLAVTTASMAFFSPASGAASTEQEISRLDHLHAAVTSAYASSRNFNDLVAYTASQNGWLQDGSGNWHSTAWGDLSLTPTNMAGLPGDGWQVELTTLPADVCQRIAGAEVGQWTHVYVDGHEVADNADATALCTAGSHTLVAQSYGGRRPGYVIGPTLTPDAPLCVQLRKEGTLGVVRPDLCGADNS